MIEVGVKELKDRLSQYLRHVASGERIRVTSRGRAVAEILPVGDDALGPKVRALVAQGRVALPAKPLPSRAPPLESPSRRRSLPSELILAEREAER